MATSHLARAVGPQVPLGTQPSPSLGRRILWYVPNRLLDLSDILRLRLRAGPGLAAGIRISDYGAFFAGRYDSVYVGLPGPRNPYAIRPPAGLENLRGIVIGGVDATDNTPHGPAYGPAEVDIGAHLLLLGAEAGFDPFELVDFLGGFLLLDLSHDDRPRASRKEPDMTSAISPRTCRGAFEVSSKPEVFLDLADRLDYLHTNVQRRVSEPLRSVDEYFALDGEGCESMPDSRLRIGLYSESVQSDRLDASIKADVDLDVAMPNLQRRLHLFIQSTRADDLPGLSPVERRSRGLTLGLRRFLRDCSVTADAGVRLTMRPRAYARATWHREYELGSWIARPQARVFLDSHDRLGSLVTLSLDRWLGAGHEYFVGGSSSVKYTTRSEALTWEESLRMGWVRSMIEDHAFEGRYDRRNVAEGGAIAFRVFGTDTQTDLYRFTVGMRRPLYKGWIFLEVEPGLEWARENDFDTALRLILGLDMLFYGPAGE